MSRRQQVMPSSASNFSRQRTALWTLLLLSILAMVDGVYLTLVHLDLVVGGRSFGGMCHALARRGCDVTGGRFGSMGDVPTALVGFAGALATAVVCMQALRGRDAARSAWLQGLRALTFISVLASIGMALASWVEGAFCPLCVVWYGLNFASAAAAGVAWGARNEADGAPSVASLKPVAGLAVVVFSLGLVVGQGAYVAVLTPRMATRAAEVTAKIQRLKQQPRAVIRVAGTVVGATIPGVVSLVVFSDFACPHCRKLWHRLEALQAISARKITVTHLHFPLDPTCHAKIGYAMHPHACAAAWASECARDLGKFRDYARKLFAHQDALTDPDLQGYAAALGLVPEAFTVCMASERIRKRVTDHVQAGFDVKVRGTPTLFANGISLPVNLSAPLLVKAIDAVAED